MSLDLLTQLSAEDLQDMLKEAGLDNSVHRHRLLEALDCLQEELGSDSGLQVMTAMTLLNSRAGLELRT